jgi:hypothetical protein
MRFAAVVVLAISASAALAQPDLWSHVKPHFDTPQLSAAAVSDSRRAAIHRLIREHRKTIGWECGGDQLDAMLKGLTFESILLSPEHEVLLVETGAGCARGGQGSNGAMWLVRFDGDAPVLMATPKDGFNGWIFSIQPSTSHGFRDIILGWSMGAAEGNLNYLRFDGKSYQCIGSATYTTDDGDHLKIVPIPK